jgi:hypothetical protein
MADTGPEDVEKRALLAFLDAQRAAMSAGRTQVAHSGPPLPARTSVPAVIQNGRISRVV